jgi:hypothetical protein
MSGRRFFVFRVPCWFGESAQADFVVERSEAVQAQF